MVWRAAQDPGSIGLLTSEAYIHSGGHMSAWAKNPDPGFFHLGFYSI